LAERVFWNAWSDG